MILDAMEALAPNIIKLKSPKQAIEVCKSILEKEQKGTLKS